VGLVLESGEPREVHHFALLIGYGAGAVNPYLAFETLHDLVSQGMLPGVDEEHAVKYYLKALNKGVVKVISKMGISTIQSYCGAQIFEGRRPGQGRHRQVLHLDARRASAASAST
jgi:glutamate synthase (ferredoxin)